MKSSKYFTRFDEIINNQPNHKSNEEFYILKCPLCMLNLNYNKSKLYIKKDYSFGYCQRCKTTFFDRNIVYSSPDIVTYNPYNLQDSNSEIKVFTSMKKYFDASDLMSNVSIDYFINKRRNPELLNLWGSYQMRNDSTGIYIPYPGFNYYIKALYQPVNDMKYYLPPTPEKPPFIINRGSDNWLICEGVFDAIALSLLNSVSNIMAVTGSDMSSPMRNYLRHQCPSSVTIFLDDSDLSRNLMDKLGKFMPACYVDIIESNGEDPEEYYLRVEHNIIK